MTGTRGGAFVLGLATGVFLGAVAAIIIIHSGFEPFRKESQAVRDARVLTMKPEQFSARCGTLVSDKLAHSPFSGELTLGHVTPPDERKVTVAMTLPSGEKENVTAVFENQAQRNKKPDWKLYSIGGYDTDTSVLGGLKTIEELYPCTTKP